MNPVEGGDSWHLTAERRLEDTKAGVFEVGDVITATDDCLANHDVGEKRL